MTKTLKSKTESKEVLVKARDSAHQVWLAGLGAVASAQDEGVKVFDTFVKQGQKLAKQGKAIEDRAVAAATARAEMVSSKTTEAIDKLEQVFQDRVSRSLSRLGVPTNDDVQTLTKRVEELTRAVNKMVGEDVKPVTRRTARA